MSDWKALADQAMADLGFTEAPGVVYATIEAETGGRNVMGDSGRAVGYGQVWLKWHWSTFLFVADRLGVKLVSRAQPDEKGEDKFQQQILWNPSLSMWLAVAVIKKMWRGSGGDWDKFLHYYVGPAIPAADIARRTALLNKYGGLPGKATVPTVPPSAPKTPHQPSQPQLPPTLRDNEVIVPYQGDGVAAGLAAVVAGVAIIALIVQGAKSNIRDERS